MSEQNTPDLAQEFAELELRIEHHTEVNKILGYLKTPKSEDELSYLEQSLETQGRGYVTERLRTEAFQTKDQRASLTYRAEGILTTIWDTIISLVKRIISFIDRAIYKARDFVFGEPTGLQNTENVSIFRRGVLSNRDYKIPYGSPLHNILVREGTKGGVVRTAEAILNAQLASLETFYYSTDLELIKKFMTHYANDANALTEIREKSIELAVNEAFLAGINKKEIGKVSSFLRTGARTVLYTKVDDENQSFSVYEVPPERFPRQEFQISGVGVLLSLDNIEQATKILDKLIRFEEKELKSFLVKVENDLVAKRKQKADPVTIDILRASLMVARNFAVIVGKFQETYRPLRNFKWLDKIELVKG